MLRTLRLFCDLHIHSHYSRATSEMMDLPRISHYASLKGLDVIGTGDSTHPQWLGEIKENLAEDENGFLRFKDRHTDRSFVLSGEVSTVCQQDRSSKRIHHILLQPDIDCVEQVNDILCHLGNLASDGRPILRCSPAELVQLVSEVSDQIEVFPAHIWTPHFSIFGLHGFNSVEECYGDRAQMIHALETGLSSDPPMNWRLSSLDRYVLVSNSDSHSPWPWRLGREANLFDLKEPTYKDLISALRREGGNRLLMTIETHPEYGKYHWSGHRKCGTKASPAESKLLRGICPKCGRKFTKGVEQRVAELADREKGFRPRGASDFIHLLPLSELIATALGVKQVNAARVWAIYDKLVRAFGSELLVMFDAEPSRIELLSDRRIAEAIISVREDRILVEPGYDGVYGQIKLTGTMNDMDSQ